MEKTDYINIRKTHKKVTGTKDHPLWLLLSVKVEHDYQNLHNDRDLSIIRGTQTLISLVFFLTAKIGRKL
jgi:hypothetical protein